MIHNKLKFLEEIESRYGQLKPKLSNDPGMAQEQFLKLSDLEKSYLLDMMRMIDEIKTIHQRHDDFQFVLDNMLPHELAAKVRGGKLKPEDKAPYQK